MTRTLAATACGLLAAVLLPLSILAAWVDGVVTDTDRYVETVAPLAEDEVVKAAAAKQLERETLRLIASSGVPVPQNLVEGLVHRAVERVVDSPAFRTAWVRANRTAHRQLVAVLEGRTSVEVNESGQVTVELGSVLDTIAQELAAGGVPGLANLPDVRVSIAVVDADRLARAQRVYEVIDTLGVWLPIAWAVLTLVTLLLSRRRLAATAKLALGSLVALGVLALLLVFARDEVTADLPQREVAMAVWDVLLVSLWHALEVAALVLAVVALVAGLLGRSRSRSSTESAG
jgi:hypothetical protein